MFWHVSVCLSRGGTPVRSKWGAGGGVPQSGPDGGGVPAMSRWGGVPWPGPDGGGVPWPGLDGGYPGQVQTGGYPGQVQVWGYPSQVQMGEVHRPGPDGGYMGYPQPGQDRGVPPPSPVQDSRWSTWYAAVCLLRSRRRTVLFYHVFQISFHTHVLITHKWKIISLETVDVTRWPCVGKNMSLTLLWIQETLAETLKLLLMKVTLMMNNSLMLGWGGSSNKFQ